MAFWRPGPIGSGRVEWCDFHTGQPWIGANDPNEPSEKIVVWMNLPDLPSLESAGPARWSRETNRAYAQNRDPRGTERQL